MTAIIRLFDPTCDKLVCQTHQFFCSDFIATQLAQLCEGAQPTNCLRRKIHVVREVTREIVCAELILWIKSLCLQVIRPLQQDWPILGTKISIALNLRKSSQ